MPSGMICCLQRQIKHSLNRKRISAGFLTNCKRGTHFLLGFMVFEQSQQSAFLSQPSRIKLGGKPSSCPTPNHSSWTEVVVLSQKRPTDSASSPPPLALSDNVPTRPTDAPVAPPPKTLITAACPPLVVNSVKRPVVLLGSQISLSCQEQWPPLPGVRSWKGLYSDTLEVYLAANGQRIPLSSLMLLLCHRARLHGHTVWIWIRHYPLMTTDSHSLLVPSLLLQL